jgi:hypothetical protein
MRNLKRAVSVDTRLAGVGDPVLREPAQSWRSGLVAKPNPKVVLFSGHMIDAPDREKPPLPA